MTVRSTWPLAYGDLFFVSKTSQSYPGCISILQVTASENKEYIVIYFFSRKPSIEIRRQSKRRFISKAVGA